eukprot:TRINITY_DN48163_c0_g1_i1.p1 TRINITY_DN48163_c0_g1~~TRINITY_DN48163_c0_g1_i1.p1  ORF type:complete len:134 (+),score=1.43 TRINITY_DN48163_c0_g1_i1:67-468(+)
MQGGKDTGTSEAQSCTKRTQRPTVTLTRDKANMGRRHSQSPPLLHNEPLCQRSDCPGGLLSKRQTTRRSPRLSVTDLVQCIDENIDRHTRAVTLRQLLQKFCEQDGSVKSEGGYQNEALEAIQNAHLSFLGQT